MNVALALFVVVGFAVMLEYLELPDHARAVGDRSSCSFEVLRDDFLCNRKEEVPQ
ncbi:hypothetical protein [Salinibacter ruber]|uniref:hypothetical protein n=1 Tax=Salinibacter ruber TaxID=146919 RepID=UPI0021675B15|nr:hypothetical protein [Salinibacter ruber]MCS4199766.1 hypothetical protein [Salinibacter ruber]